MNPLLQFILSTMMTSGVGDRFGGSNPGDDLTKLMAKLPDPKEKGPQDRLSDAFTQLKNMHKDPALEQAMSTPASGGPSQFDQAQWPYGPVGAPSQAMASSPAVQGQPGVPMPAPRPTEAPQAPPEMSFFQRNAMLQRDPLTGEYLDPAQAASAEQSPFKGLFG
jgi:hypothetical protein